ncbi:MAG: hypothetical protein GX940_11580, partial [Clostridiaceae bacterium]|nr:hypothetical protein [Clostridiaceae bacterium]
KYAETLAIQKVTGEPPSQEIMDCFSEALDYLDFNDETVKGIITAGHMQTQAARPWRRSKRTGGFGTCLTVR